MVGRTGTLVGHGKLVGDVVSHDDRVRLVSFGDGEISNAVDRGGGLSVIIQRLRVREDTKKTKACYISTIIERAICRRCDVDCDGCSGTT
jgi:hypothetical protein